MDLPSNKQLKERLIVWAFELLDDIAKLEPDKEGDIVIGPSDSIQQRLKIFKRMLTEKAQR